MDDNISKEALLKAILERGIAGELAKEDSNALQALLEDQQKSEELQEVKDDNRKRRIADWIRWGVGGLAGGALAWITFYYEDNSFVSGSRGKVLSKIVDKAIFRKG